jgi:hypothetical protein
MKVLGVLLLLFEGAAAAFLISLPPIGATVGALEAKSLTDWFFVGVFAFGLPCLRGIQDVAGAFVKDFRALCEGW